MPQLETPVALYYDDTPFLRRIVGAWGRPLRREDRPPRGAVFLAGEPRPVWQRDLLSGRVSASAARRAWYDTAAHAVARATEQGQGARRTIVFLPGAMDHAAEHWPPGMARPPVLIAGSLASLQGMLAAQGVQTPTPWPLARWEGMPAAPRGVQHVEPPLGLMMDREGGVVWRLTGWGAGGAGGSAALDPWMDVMAQPWRAAILRQDPAEAEALALRCRHPARLWAGLAMSAWEDGWAPSPEASPACWVGWAAAMAQEGTEAGVRAAWDMLPAAMGAAPGLTTPPEGSVTPQHDAWRWPPLQATIALAHRQGRGAHEALPLVTQWLQAWLLLSAEGQASPWLAWSLPLMPSLGPLWSIVCPPTASATVALPDGAEMPHVEAVTATLAWAETAPRSALLRPPALMRERLATVVRLGVARGEDAAIATLLLRLGTGREAAMLANTVRRTLEEGCYLSAPLWEALVAWARSRGRPRGIPPTALRGLVRSAWSEACLEAVTDPTAPVARRLAAVL